MNSKAKIALLAAVALVVILASIAVASAIYPQTRQNNYQATYGNYAPFGGYGMGGSGGQSPNRNGYPQSGYGSNYGYPGGGWAK